MVPLLPCASVDEIADFFQPMGFKVTYRQMRPNPYLALSREGIDLHYFGMDGFRPEDSYGSCLIVVPGTQPLFDVFAAGLRERYGKLPMSGFPRITRPRRRKNAGNLSGFSLVDPAGNWIRVVTDPSRAGPEEPQLKASKLSRAMADAIVFADSKDDLPQAIKILSRALDRPDAADDEPGVRAEAEDFLMELTGRASNTL
jgi:hypothetical protein